jgi:hypothetical protein
MDISSETAAGPAGFIQHPMERAGGSVNHVVEHRQPVAGMVDELGIACASGD